MRFSDQNGFDMAATVQNACFDGRVAMLPRHRTKCSTVIGRSLMSLYKVPTDTADAIERVLGDIERQLTTAEKT